MATALTLPRLVSGTGALAMLPDELQQLGVARPLLLSDRGIERAGLVARVQQVLGGRTLTFLDVPENPTAAGADAAWAAYREGGADGIIALGGGSVLDTAKLVAGLVAAPSVQRAAQLIGHPELIGAGVAPLVAIPTTVGTGSESSPVAGIHIDAKQTAIGTRTWRLVPRVALCDVELTRTLPRRLVAATGIDALSHCIEGYFSDSPQPFIDAVALDGMALAWRNLRAALEPGDDAARTALMAAAYAGGIAIHKGLGTAHAVAGACGEQDLHHGTLIAVALPRTVPLMTRHRPEKAARVAAALGLPDAGALPGALLELNRALGLPGGLKEAGYRAGPMDALVAQLLASPFNRSSAHVPNAAEYRAIAEQLLA